MSVDDLSYHVLPSTRVIFLDASEAFGSLNHNERMYAHSIAETSWIGCLIDLIQTSPEAGGIFLVFQRIFQLQTPEEVVEAAKVNGLTDEECDSVLTYIGTFNANLGNYLSFGDTKFIPSLPIERFTVFITSTHASQDESSGVLKLWKEISPAIYSLIERRRRLDFGPTAGLTTYYSENVERGDVELVQTYLNSKKLEGYNTRIFKQADSDGKQILMLKLASAMIKNEEVERLDNFPKNTSLQLCYGDYSELMSLLVESILIVQSHSLNDTQKAMWEKYAEGFSSGCINKHKEGSRLWIKDKMPAVESYIGFIESYRDPYGIRGEFESFVAVVNKQMSKKFQFLVEQAVEILCHLPWDKCYEKDIFLQPDFTSLDVIAFAQSGIPVGINIPNYDDIRQTEGFKNVSLGNVLGCRFNDPTTTFIKKVDKDLYLQNVLKAFQIQVGLHELLGHGSGKLFRKEEDGKFNFDQNSVKDLLTGGQITSWYAPGETWDSKFCNLSSPFEECRAECVGVYLCSLPAVLRVFESRETVVAACENGSGGIGAGEANGVPDVVYINWLHMARSGLMATEFYSPAPDGGDSEAGAWRQAHCQARFAILKIMLEVQLAAVRIEEIVGDDGQPDLLIHMDRSRLDDVRKAVGDFLNKLQYYKSTGNVEDGGAFFRAISTLSPEQLHLREIVIARKQPRPVFLQPVTRLCKDKGPTLISYPATHAGLIRSFTDRYSPAQSKWGARALDALEAVWQRDQPYFAALPL